MSAFRTMVKETAVGAVDDGVTHAISVGAALSGSWMATMNALWPWFLIGLILTTFLLLIRELLNRNR
jgi:hypothetical protein